MDRLTIIRKILHKYSLRFLCTEDNSIWFPKKDLQKVCIACLFVKLLAKICFQCYDWLKNLDENCTDLWKLTNVAIEAEKHETICMRGVEICLCVFPAAEKNPDYAYRSVVFSSFLLINLLIAHIGRHNSIQSKLNKGQICPLIFNLRFE